MIFNSFCRRLHSARLALLLLAALALGSSECLRAAGPEPTEAELRKRIVEVILSDSDGREADIRSLASTGSRLIRDILLAWPKDRILLFEPSGGVKIPALIEEETDSDGKCRAFRIDTGALLSDASGKPLKFAVSELTTAETDSSLRSWIQRGLDTLALSDPSSEARKTAVLKLGNSKKMSNLVVLKDRFDIEPEAEVRKAIQESMALLHIGDPDLAVRKAAIQELGRLESIGGLDVLKHLAADVTLPIELKRSVVEATQLIENHINNVNVVGTLFRGLSLGSILLIVALGLAITFGLMGVINMAHGEMIAIGAYTTYVVQNLFGSGFGFSITLPFHFSGKALSFGMQLPGLNATGALYESYFLVAIPLSFLMAALAGLVIERVVIRFLYRRPLESLLATWGVSLVMQQLFRMVFGANNVQVSSPRWLLGHFNFSDVLLGYNRVFVIGFAVLIVVGTWLLLTRTPLGLLIRAVMQNRDMAACIGVRTQRVNQLTFALGSGLAGLAGAFLSQIGNVGPSLGQSYIVDAFMTVVVGGVGSIVGTVCSAIGIGTADQILQQATGSPVTGKIVVLVAIILFLQWRPGGLFSIRSRSLD